MLESVICNLISCNRFCGACWALSAINQVESDAIRLKLIQATDHLSAEQLISCAHNSLGCQGGWTEVGFEYIEQNGVALFSDYPYSEYWQLGKAAECHADGAMNRVSLTSVYSLETEDQMIDHVKGVGPLSVCIDASTWQTYSGGIVTSCGNTPNHCVQLVGVNTDENYWKLRNSWGSDWGEEGYIRISLGSNTCAITTDPQYTVPTLVKHDSITVQGVSVSTISKTISIDNPDPYLIFSLGTQSHTTNVLQNEFNPHWPDSFDIIWDGISNLKVSLHDSNWFFPDDSIGDLDISLNSITFPPNSFMNIHQTLDDSLTLVNFSIRLNPILTSNPLIFSGSQALRDGKIIDAFSGAPLIDSKRKKIM